MQKLPDALHDTPLKLPPSADLGSGGNSFVHVPLLLKRAASASGLLPEYRPTATHSVAVQHDTSSSALSLLDRLVDDTSVHALAVADIPASIAAHNPTIALVLTHLSLITNPLVSTTDHMSRGRQ
jgi:hypothetical protein